MTLLVGDCVEVMAGLPAGSVDAVVTDPPYGIGFMGKDWDTIKGDDRDWGRMGGPTGRDNRTHTQRGGAMHAGKYDLSLPANHAFQAWVGLWAAEALRVLKPGGHLLAFGGTRTYHRLTCALEDAGFEIRDCLAWLYGSGFPKSLDVSKAIDKAAGAEREVVSTGENWGASRLSEGKTGYGDYEGSWNVTAPATDDARAWDGWGTALKPAHEPIVLARKPLAGTVAANVVQHGTGALNVDGCRIGADGGTRNDSRGEQQGVTYARGALAGDYGELVPGLGRWPANVLLDEQAAHMLDQQTGESVSRAGTPRAGRNGDGWGMTATGAEYDDSGGASRFFYVAKASRAERNAGLDGFDPQILNGFNASPRVGHGEVRNESPHRNHHPTVKPVALMRWLIRLITPPNGTILDPFTGSGTTGIAAALEHVNFIGIERDKEYAAIAQARIAFWTEHGDEALEIVARAERAEQEREQHAAAGQTSIFDLT